MDKPFKTYDELISLMNSRGLKTGDRAMFILEREGYYPVVNGYKSLFIDRAANGETYKRGCEFEELYDLFVMDRRLRAVLFRHIALCEGMLKTVSTYRFCEAHPDDNEAYLDERSYRRDRSRLVASFTHELKRILGRIPEEPPRFTKEYLEHYKANHDNIPLWVTMNSLSLTQAFKFYTNQTEAVRFAIAQDFQRMHRDAFGSRARRITHRSLQDAYDHIKDFRNVCAHDERLYCARVDKSKSTNLRRLLSDMRLVLNAEQCRSLENGITRCLDFASESIHTVSEREIVREMGFESRKEISSVLNGYS